MLREKIEAFSQSLGISCIGFVPCRLYEELRPFYESRQVAHLQNEFEEEDLEKRINPAHYMPEAQTIISIAFPYAHEEEVEEDNGFSIYTKRGDYHRVVKGYLEQMVNFIENLGGRALSFVDSNTLPERYIAYLAGVGFIGRNNMLITKPYGSYVFLGEIITDLKLSCEEVRSYETLAEYKECGTCKICYGQCPTKSINGYRCNPNICLSYMTQKKELSEEEIGLLKGNVFGCDFCQLKCPYNEGVEKNVLKEFESLAYMNEPAEVYAAMDNSYFKQKISGTSCGWRGKNVIRRNALIHMAQKGKDIQQFKGESPYINNYIERLEKKYHK